MKKHNRHTLMWYSVWSAQRRFKLNTPIHSTDSFKNIDLFRNEMNQWIFQLILSKMLTYSGTQHVAQKYAMALLYISNCLHRRKQTATRNITQLLRQRLLSCSFLICVICVLLWYCSNDVELLFIKCFTCLPQ